MENNDYSTLYSKKEPEMADPHADAYNDYLERELIRKGKIKTTVLGVLMLIGTGINLLRTFPDLENGFAYWLGEVFFIALCVAVTIMFMQGKNGARITIGVFSCISFAAALVVIASVFHLSASQLDRSLNAGDILFFVLISLIPLSVTGVFIWFTLIDKSVKAYCLSTKTERGTDNGRT